MSKLPEEFSEDAHELVRKAIGAIEWVSGTGLHMGVLEANGLKQEEAIKEAGASVRDGLTQVALALGQIADELTAARREREMSTKQ